MAVAQTLTVTEVAGSQDIAANTSKVRILWKSKQSGPSYNSYTRTAYYWITTPDGVETKYSVSYTLPLETNQTILDKTITVTHKNDGSGSVSVRTWMDTDISAGVVELGPEKVTLETIPRVSGITSAADVVLGSACSVKWTPKSADFRYKLKFTLGDSYTTGVIHPNKTSTYTYSGYKIPLSFAEHITGGKTGTMTVELFTYSDSAGTKQVGAADSATFTVTVPDSSETQPTVTMTLSPVSSLPDAFDGLYIQGKSKVKAALTAKGKYDATIKSYSMKAEGVTYDADDDYTSAYLAQYGSIKIYGYAKDSRGHTGSVEKSITVIGYSRPQVLPVTGETDVVAARCDDNGNPTDNGTSLIIKAKRSYSKVTLGGVQRNFCKLQYRYKIEGGDYSNWVTILEADSLGSDEIVTGALLKGTLSTKSSYIVQVRAADDIGENTPVTITIPTDKVYMHRDGRRRSLTFGGYVEDDNTFAIAEDITFEAKGPIQAHGGGNIDILTLGKKITATAGAKVSLNNYQTPGNYYSPNADNSQYITDSPYTVGGFGMTVRQLQTTGYIRQELFYARTTWIRHFDGTDWSDWWRYLTTTVPETPATDYVIETGVSDGWTYKKWKGGTYELFGTFEITPSESTKHETLYRTNNMTIDVPFTISSAIVSGTAVGYYWITNGGKSGDSAITLRIMGDKEFSTTTAIEVRLMVVGTYE